VQGAKIPETDEKIAP